MPAGVHQSNRFVLQDDWQRFEEPEIPVDLVRIYVTGLKFAGLLQPVGLYEPAIAGYGAPKQDEQFVVAHDAIGLATFHQVHDLVDHRRTVWSPVDEVSQECEPATICRFAVLVVAEVGQQAFEHLHFAVHIADDVQRALREAGNEWRRTGHRESQAVLRSVNLSIACRDLSWPLPDCLTPPSGKVMSAPP